ncbi:hypothetical protein HYDPIDRAFT_108983 [Hydnomerulius pinastri MD-312]|nr:hypothetical protein HYDPIDRAFT_108983 [Hydnomerulius pinastri MD-312]
MNSLNSKQTDLRVRFGMSGATLCIPRFGEEPEEKMVAWAKKNVKPESNPNVLDVGSGNGHLLFALVEEGYEASRLIGIDYSQGSVDLSVAIGEKRACDSEQAQDNVTFAVCDFLNPESPIPPPNGETSDGAWDLIMDKGTYDAIALMEKDAGGNAPVDSYPPRVAKLLKPGGCFLITCT